MPYYYKPIYQPHYQDPTRDPYLWRISIVMIPTSPAILLAVYTHIQGAPWYHECAGSSASKQAEASAMKSSLSLPPHLLRHHPAGLPTGRPRGGGDWTPLGHPRASEPPMMPTRRTVPAGGRGGAGARRNDLYCSAEGGKWHF